MLVHSNRCDWIDNILSKYLSFFPRQTWQPLLLFIVDVPFSLLTIADLPHWFLVLLSIINNHTSASPLFSLFLLFFFFFFFSFSSSLSYVFSFVNLVFDRIAIWFSFYPSHHSLYFHATDSKSNNKVQHHSLRYSQQSATKCCAHYSPCVCQQKVQIIGKVSSSKHINYWRCPKY